MCNLNAPRVVLVLGMHRSGTSVVARALTSLAVKLGGNLIPAGGRNPKGYFEDRAFVSINSAVLASFELSWSSLKEVSEESLERAAAGRLGARARQVLESRIALYRPFGFKDPRSCRLLPFWNVVMKDISDEVGCVVVARNPMAVARSLQERNRFSAEYALELWHLHMKPLVSSIDARWKKVTVDYDLLLQAPKQQLHRIANALQLPLPQTTAIEEFCNSFLDPNLRHNKPCDIRGAAADVRETWDELQRMSLLV